MEPFHPKLRQGFLEDQGNRDAGLTSTLLLEYEELLVRLYYRVYYPEPGVFDDRERIYRITGPGLENMRQGKVPEDVLGNLEQLKQSFPNEAEFLEAVKEQIADDELFDQYIERILRYSRFLPGNKISDETVENLTAAKVPPDIVEKLTSLKERKFTEEGKFFKEVRKALGKDALQYISLIEIYSKQAIEDREGPRRLFDPTRPAPDLPTIQENPFEEVKFFRQKYIPNFDRVYNNWLADQKKNVTRRHHDLNPGNVLRNSLVLFGIWLIGIILAALLMKG